MCKALLFAYLHTSLGPPTDMHNGEFQQSKVSNTLTPLLLQTFSPGFDLFLSWLLNSNLTEIAGTIHLTTV